MENNSEPSEAIAAEPTIAEPTNAAPTQPKGTAWPFIVYFLALLLVDGLGSAVARKDPSEFLMIPLIGILYGQTALAMVVGGLMGRNWLEGVYLATFAVMCQFAISGLSSGSFTELKSLLAATTIPLLCFVGASPLILLRWTVGWQLRTETMVTLPRSRITIEDLILVPASLVAIWVMAIAPMDVSNGPFQMPATILFIGVVFILPCTYWAFRIRGSVLRWVLCMGYTFLLPSIGAFIGLTAYNWLPGDAIGWVVFGMLLCTAVFMLGLQLLYSGGYRLVNYKSAAVAHGVSSPSERNDAPYDNSPFDLEPIATPTSRKAYPQASNRKRYRLAVAALLIATATVNTGIWTFAQMQQRRALVKIIANGGKVEMANGKPIKISFGPATTEEEIYQIPSMPTVTSISVAGTKITSFYLRNNLNSLTSLDIRKTNLGPFNLGLSPSIEIIVSEGQFTDAELQDLKLRGLVIKEVAD